MNNIDVRYSVGALLYSPALNDKIASSILNGQFGKTYSVALCLEDTIADSAVGQALEQLGNTFKTLHLAFATHDVTLPKIFVRVRNPEQISVVYQKISCFDELFSGFIFPKYSLANADEYNSEFLKVLSQSSKQFYMMPILESEDIVDYTTRPSVLIQLKQKIDDMKDHVLNVRVGGNDFSNALKNYAKTTAAAIASLAEKIYSLKGDSLVIVSLARAGTPIGVLIKRYLEKKYCVQLTHYSISIIRGRGIDKNALDYILARHNAESVQFVDGWIGKGAILGELVKELRDYPQLSSDLAVVSDPANLTDLCGTHEDFLIPSSCLNATVTGLISRTFLRHDIIGKTDFHGAAFLGELTDSDLTEEYLTAIEREFDYSATNHVWAKGLSGVEVVKKIANTYAIDDINFIKPGIGETTRVLLRRIPWKVLVNPKHNGADELQHIIQLAHDKGVPVELSSVDLGNYKVCGIIKNLADM